MAVIKRPIQPHGESDCMPSPTPASAIPKKIATVSEIAIARCAEYDGSRWMRLPRDATRFRGNEYSWQCLWRAGSIRSRETSPRETAARRLFSGTLAVPLAKGAVEGAVFFGCGDCSEGDGLVIA